MMAIACARLMGDPPDLLISPELSGIGVFDFHRGDELIAIGEAAVEPHLLTIRRYLKTPQASDPRVESD